MSNQGNPMTTKIEDAAKALRGLAAVIRKYGTCAPAALEEIADRLAALSAREGGDQHAEAGAVAWCMTYAHPGDPSICGRGVYFDRRELEADVADIEEAGAIPTIRPLIYGDTPAHPASHPSYQSATDSAGIGSSQQGEKWLREKATEMRMADADKASVEELCQYLNTYVRPHFALNDSPAADKVRASGVKRVLRDCFFDAANQQHIPTLTVEFEPVRVGEPNDAPGWTARDNLAAALSPPANGENDGHR
jgi:hypothetical protein